MPWVPRTFRFKKNITERIYKMLFDPSCKIRMAVWHDPEIGNAASVFYLDGFRGDPRLAYGPTWFRTKYGVGRRLRKCELTRYHGRHPLTMGFFEAHAEAGISLGRPKCRLGHFEITLEARNLSWKKPKEFGRKIGALKSRGISRVQDSPFEIYYLDADARHKFDDQRIKAIEKYYRGVEGLAPDAGLRLTAILDSRLLYVRDIPFTPVNEVSEIKAVMEKQIHSLVLDDERWIDAYLHQGQFPLDNRQIPGLYARMPV